MKGFVYLCPVLLLFSSCKEEENISRSFLDGTYETIWENQASENWSVNQLKFDPDGSFEQTTYLRDSVEGERIGYIYFSKGIYTIQGEDFTLLETERNGKEFGGYPLSPSSNIEDLEEIEMLPEGRENIGRLEVIDGGNSLAIRMGCYVESGICLNLYTTIIYKKID